MVNFNCNRNEPLTKAFSAKGLMVQLPFTYALPLAPTGPGCRSRVGLDVGVSAR